MKKGIVVLSVLMSLSLSAFARSNSSEAPSSTKGAQAAQYEVYEALPTYEFGDHTIVVLDAETTARGATWALDIDGRTYGLSLTDGAAALLNAQGQLIVGWRDADNGLTLYEGNEMVASEATFEELPSEFGLLYAAVLDANFLEQLSMDSFGAQRAWPIVAGLALFVAACIDIEYSSTTTTDGDGCVTTSTTTTLGWDCELPEFDGANTGSVSDLNRAR